MVFLSLHVSLLHQKHAWYLQGPEEIVGFPGTGIAESMSSHMGAENQLAINGWAISLAPIIIIIILEGGLV